MSTLTPERETRLRALAQTLRDDYHLTGPWRWFGNLNGGGGGGPYLATQHGGRVYVMRFARLGFAGAQPELPVRDDDGPVMRRAAEVPVFEVCRDATSKDDPRVYRDDVCGFRSPVADWLAEIDADTILALLDELAETRAQLDLADKQLASEGI